MTKQSVNWYGRADRTMSCNLVRDWPNVPVERAQGCWVYGPAGQRYLDFCGGMASVNTGHCHPKVVAAIKEQAEKLLHGPMGILLYEPIVKLAERLGRHTPGELKSFFFLNSGSEAVEGAIKLARYATGRPVVIAFYGGFHGRTMGATTLTASKSKYRKRYEPLVGGVHHIPYPYCFRCPCGLEPDSCDVRCFDFVEKVFAHLADPSDIAAFILEPVLGEGGYTPAPAEYLRRLRRVCDQHGILLIFDEVQTGFGRTGTMFACEGLGVIPDILALAKGIASGLPLGATVASPELMAKWPPGAHSTTFGGNPVACAAALATLEVFEEEELLQNCRRQGERAMARLGSLPQRFTIVGDVRGRGLMIGVEFVRPDDGRTPDEEAAEAVLKGCLEKSLILYPCGTWNQSIRFIPPLIVSESELDTALDILEEVVSDVNRRRAAIDTAAC